MDISTWLSQAVACIPSDAPQLEAELLLADRLGKTRAYLVAFSDEILCDDLLAQLDSELSRLATGYPLAYLLGKKGFWDMDLRVTEATLIPRPDTELLIEVAIELLPRETTANFIDLGTGSGAIAIALSREFPNAVITATDKSASALSIAQQNALDWQVARIEFVQTSWLDGFLPHQFDVIVSNPPYIVENDPHLEKLTHEPISALTAPNKGLADIEMIIFQSQSALTSGGWLLLEHGYDQGQSVRDLFSPTIWENVQTHRDLGGNERVTVGKLRLQ